MKKETTESPKLANRAAALDAQAEELNAVPPAPEAAVPAPLDGPTSVGPSDEPAAHTPALTPEQEARSLIDTAVELALPWCPALAEVYTDDARARLATAAAPLMAKYNVSIGSIFDQWKEEIGFAIVALPLVLQTVKVLEAERAKKAKKKEAPPSPAPTSAGDVQAPLVMK